MQVTLGLISILGLSLCSSFSNNVNVPKQIIDWSNYGYDEILRDTKLFTNQSEADLFELIMRRYPGLIVAFKGALIQMTTNGSFNEEIFCDEMDLAIRRLNDSCRRSVIETSMDINLTKACNESIYAAGLADKKMSQLCTAKLDTRSMDITNITVRYQSGSFFHAMKLLTGTAAVAIRRRCAEVGGMFDEETSLCVKNGTAFKIQPLIDESLRTTIVVGNCISFVSLTVLLVTYKRFKKYCTLAGRNIISLSAALLVAHFLQIVLEYLYKNNSICRVGGIILHFVLLSAFSWMGIIAFEFHYTFSKVRPVDQHQRKKRFQKYVIVSFTISTVVLLICLMIDIPEERYSGYGLDGKCFVTKFWTNLFAFIIPVALVLIYNLTFLTLTIWSLYKIKRSTGKSLKSSTKTAVKKREMLLSIMALKLSILLGFGWILGFIEATYESLALKYIYSVVISLQGLLVFLAFGCHKECWELIKKRSTLAATQTRTFEMNVV